ncbi:uncharacterized protein LOC129755050 [Uranotaenia lowii]|uniref:uncharacterized protein LOC129755050 n=1 Tax=Uranotaenia lowii TaxID=190385 RepID=UPI0024798FAD|nr:uncharacterized protein LOC129755050 [Uranotaenia lowii]XP_055607333.1 uncharacterized protein LOC129755050 [Uranotaenia lowii]
MKGPNSLALFTLLAMFHQVSADIDLQPALVRIQPRWNEKITSEEERIDLRTCAGAVVGHRHILTTASCLFPDANKKMFRVLPFCGNKGQDVAELIVHQNYAPKDEYQSMGNLAVLVVKNDFSLLTCPMYDLAKPTEKLANRSFFLDSNGTLQQIRLLKTDLEPDNELDIPTDKAVIMTECEIEVGNPVLHERSDGEWFLGALMGFIPEQCGPTSLSPQLTLLNVHYLWIRGVVEKPVSQEMPTMVVFNMLKLMTVVGSLSGISFAFCCVMYLVAD